ncbi:uncharacterized protein LOC121428316 [Lytechinus variegatus]|uniref:uncharacterized protein LOC121428316 n=1 Tax=Lytechinus variegatus TaxID=7654 RepID=UPI001BB2B875|nr:uncharacterized protein LOC121428316 [Lytechinus variegatus]
MQALSPTEDSVKQPVPTTLTWKDPVEITPQFRGSNGVSGSPAAGPPGDMRGMNPRNGPSFNPQQQLGSMNIQQNTRPQNGHQEFGNPFMEASQQSGIPESVMVMPIIDSISISKHSSDFRSNSSSPPSSRKAVRSRARPRKPEEPAPFLSVDTLPADKILIEGKSNSSKQLSKKPGRSVPKRISPDFIPPTSGRRSQTPNHPPFSPYGGGKSTPRVPSRAGSSLHNYNSFFTHKNSAFLAGPPSLWSLGNRFWPHQATPNEGRRRLAPIQAPLPLDASTLKANYQVSQPFKHSVDNSTPIERPLSPSQDLKESTLLALHEVTQALARQQDPPSSRKGGRLLKGKLKPLHTFKMDGPGIEECQGILTEDGNEGQTADKARLLQRKKELLSMLPPDVFQRSSPGSTGHTRPATQGSIHRNSIVSALSLDRENYPASQPSMQQGQLRSQSMVEGSGSIAPFNSMVMIVDDSVINQVDIPAVDPDAKGPETTESPRAKEEGMAIPDAEHLTAGGDADKLSDAASESNMSDYLSELGGGRAEILCNMVKKNSQARNDLTQVDDEPSDATELENGYDDEYPLESVQQKDLALDTVEIGDGSGENKNVPMAMKSESQPSVDNEVSNSNNVESENVPNDKSESNGDYPEQSGSPSILKDSITHSNNVVDISEQNQRTMQSEIVEEAVTTQEHLEQLPVSNRDSGVSEKATDENTGIDVVEPNVQSEPNMQNASDESNGSKLVENTKETIDESNNNSVPGLNESHQKESQDLNNNPSFDDSVSADIESHSVSNNIETNPTREQSATGDIIPSDDVIPQTKNIDPVKTGGTDSIPIIINENDSSITSSQIEQKTLPAEDQQQAEMSPTSEIVSNTADHKSDSGHATTSVSGVTQDCENNELGEESSEILSSAMKEEEKKEEEEVDDDVKDTKEKDDGDDGDRGTGGGSGNNGGDGAGGGSGSGQGGNSSHSNGDGASGGGEGGGDGKDKDDNPKNNPNGNNPTENTEAKSDEEDQEIDFKSLEQLLKEIQAQALNRKEEMSSYDDIPEVDDPFLFCDNCGLDEDTCVCPDSSLHRLLGQDNIQNRPELEDEELLDESSQQQNIVLEYKMLLGDPHPGTGCYSDDLLSPREAWNEDRDDLRTSRSSRARPKSGLPNDIMLATGVSMTPMQRPVSAKLRPGSSRLSRPSSHRRTKEGREAKIISEDVDTMSDSGCGSEMSEAVTQASQLFSDEMEEDYNLDDDLDQKAQQQEQFGTEITENESKSANLEVVASSKPRHAKTKTDDAPVLAPFPPLCFKINARPPPGKLYYFSYGPTMNPNRLSMYIGSQAEQRLWGILFGFALKFNKKGEDLEAGGFANIEFSPESSVEGCVYCMNPSQLESLDKFMGCPEFYTKIVLPVWMVNCPDPNQLGVAQYCIPAVMYIAQDKWTHTDESSPLASGYSVRQCMTGADLLSPAYKQHIQTLVC